MPGQCLSALPESNGSTFQVRIEGFDVAIMLMTNRSSRSRSASESNWTSVIERAFVSVSREEIELPPPVHSDSRGVLDYRIQAEYFSERTERFASAGRAAINRIIKFFRFSLNTPLLQELPASHQCFHNPKWTNEQGEIVGKATHVFVLQGVPGLWGELDVEKLTINHLDALNSFLGDPRDPSLTEQLLSDAQGAWFEGNLRRSVLEMAIACEVAVKRQFFSAESPAGAAFDYLEGKLGI